MVQPMQIHYEKLLTLLIIVVATGVLLQPIEAASRSIAQDSPEVTQSVQFRPPNPRCKIYRGAWCLRGGTYTIIYKTDFTGTKWEFYEDYWPRNVSVVVHENLACKDVRYTGEYSEEKERVTVKDESILRNTISFGEEGKCKLVIDVPVAARSKAILNFFTGNAAFVRDDGEEIPIGKTLGNTFEEDFS